ncbi:MAG: tetratricopeptide repeat protein [Bacteroidota bacterium]
MRKISLLLSLLVICCLQFTWAQTAQQFMRNGLSALEDRQYNDALRYFEDVLRLDPDFPGAAESRGNVLFAMGEYPEAERAYSDALEIYLRKKYDRTGRGTQIERDGLVVVGPNTGAPSSGSLAAVYNNRGVARYQQGYKNEALRDFEEALRLDSNFEAARRNMQMVDRGYADNRNSGTNGGTTNDRYRLPRDRRNSSSPRVSARYERPVNRIAPSKTKIDAESIEDFREDRIEILDLNGSSRGGLFKPKKFESRRVGSRGKTYREPAVAGQTANYVEVTSVIIKPTSTLVTLTISNPDQRAYEVALDPPRSAGAFFLTGRTSASNQKFRLKNLQGVSIYPRTTKLAKGETLTVKLEFPKIPDTMGYVNLVEGSKDREDAWNFYGINLAK